VIKVLVDRMLGREKAKSRDLVAAIVNAETRLPTEVRAALLARGLDAENAPTAIKDAHAIFNSASVRHSDPGAAVARTVALLSAGTSREAAIEMFVTERAEEWSEGGELVTAHPQPRSHALASAADIYRNRSNAR
jgi:hypothetical protein